MNGGPIEGGNGEWLRRAGEVLMPTYAPAQRVLVAGQGAWVWDADGRRYLDLFGGIAVNALGHAHPDVVAAVSRQVATLGHVSNVFASPPQIQLAERLVDLVGVRGDGRVFLANSGAEAVEAALKIARRTGRPRVVAAQDGFHGRTFGALSVTWKPDYREPFEPLPGPVDFVPYGDVQALDAAIGDDTAAVILEPIQGEAGVVPAPEGYLAAARTLTAQRGALLIIDEVQTGVGRTGAFLAHTRHRIRPDVITLAKGLGGGLPIGACLAMGPAATLLGPGQHGSTFGGNPIAAAAALAVLDTVSSDELLTHVQAVGAQLRDGITQLHHPLIAEVRGEGLLIGVQLRQPVSNAVVAAAADAGYLVGQAGPQVVRLAPPLILTVDQAEQALGDLPGILDRAMTLGPTPQAVAPSAPAGSSAPAVPSAPSDPPAVTTPGGRA